MQAIIASQPGGPEVLSLAERPIPEPGPGEVLLRVRAAGVNRPDIMQRQGLAKPAAGVTDVLGLEVCGEVAACGPGLPPQAPGLEPGARVMALLPGGGYAPWCIARVEHCLPVPPQLGDAEAAALPEGLFTVWHNLFELGALKMGEAVLIHGAAGGIGTLAIRMACAAGARVIATAGRKERLVALREMGALEAICYRDTDFVAACRSLTEGRGVDVVLDVVGGDYVRRNLDALAFGGRHLSLSFLQGSQVSIELLTLMQKQLSLHASTMRPQPDSEKARMARAIACHVLPLVADGKVRPRLHAALPLAQAAEAHRLLESGEVFGKLVLLPEQAGRPT
ncbi:NAD(P)H-quinone oxidoreductase [Corticibacter populi]|uniref:NAD(P)H-quinone oxidoreductase n=2 Tax=Corticibacter populi TaxID=1550736 RepID=A0A3M6R0H1_9BURK|nr:NAD(P)H-quinone oxidoreductase [Corticibacter populi]RZS36111.1 NADPH2:quinone reductase [Corticibacter populi]